MGRVALIAAGAILGTVVAIVVNLVTSGASWWLWPILVVLVVVAIAVEVMRERREDGFAPLAGAVEESLEKQRAVCDAVGRQFFTPDLLLALLTPGSQVAQCFDEAGISSQQIRTQLLTYTSGLTPEESGAYCPFRWSERDDVRRAQRVARRFRAQVVTDVHLLLGVLDTPSSTSQLLKDEFGTTKLRLLRAAARTRAGKPAVRRHTPRKTWPEPR